MHRYRTGMMEFLQDIVVAGIIGCAVLDLYLIGSMIRHRRAGIKLWQFGIMGWYGKERMLNEAGYPFHKASQLTSSILFLLIIVYAYMTMG